MWNDLLMRTVPSENSYLFSRAVLCVFWYLQIFHFSPPLQVPIYPFWGPYAAPFGAVQVPFEKSINVKKIRKKILYIFIVESLQDLFSRTSFDYFLFSRKIVFLWAGSQFVRAPPISLQSGEPRTLKHCKTHTKRAIIFVPPPGPPSTGP